MKILFKPKTPIIFLILLICTCYFPVIKELIYDWSHDPNYSHGFLTPFVSAYLIWQKKEYLEKLKISTSYLGIIILIAGLGIYIIGTAAAEFFSVRFSFVLVILGTVLYLCGKNFIKELWFPILFLIFMIPIPYVIYYAVTFPMQLFSSKAATFILQLSGFPVLRHGNIIQLPNYALEVAEACSGIRSLITLSALGAAMAYLTQKTLFSGIILFLFSVPIAIGANVFRIIITGIGAYLISPKFANGFIHEVSGLIVFLVGFISLGAIAMIIKWFGTVGDFNPVVVEKNE